MMVAARDGVTHVTDEVNIHAAVVANAIVPPLPNAINPRLRLSTHGVAFTVAGIASAQSSVVVFGTIDFNGRYVKNDGSA